MVEMSKGIALSICFLPLAFGSPGQDQKQPTAAELSKNETPGKAIIRTFLNQEGEAGTRENCPHKPFEPSLGNVCS